MVLVVNRIFSTATLLLYAVIGLMFYKIYFQQPHYIEFNNKILNYGQNLKLSKFTKLQFKEPKLDFEQIEKIPFNNQNSKIEKELKRNKVEKKIVWKKITRSLQLNFMDPLNVPAITDVNELPKNLMAYFKEINTQNTEIDILKMKLAKTEEIGNDEDLELEFYDYSKITKQGKVDNLKENVEAVDNSKEIVEAVDNSKEIVEAVDNSKEIVEAVDNSKEIVEDIETVNIVEAVDNSKEIVEAVDKSKEIVEAVDNSKKIVEAVDNSNENVERMALNVQLNSHIKKDQKLLNKQSQNEYSTVATLQQSNRRKNGLVVTHEYSAETNIKLIGTDLRESVELVGFDLTFNETSETITDHNSGIIAINEKISESSMNRSITINKSGYVDIHLDLTYENGFSEITLPMIESERFNDLMKPFEARGIFGALLIELDDETEKVSVDVPFGKVIKLNDELKETTQEDNRYVLYLGIQAGNAVIEYVDRDGNKLKKIIHVHENALVFDPNIYEKGSVERLQLFEEDLLSKEPSKLIIPADNLLKFATKENSIKTNDNTHKINYEKNLLGNRNYVELNHLDEPLFVGFKGASKLLLPTENLIRHVLSNISGNSLQSRCVIQVNLSREIIDALVGVESVENNTFTYTQFLDQDGKFYDSPGPKTTKMVIVGEMNSAQGLNPDSKVNIKLIHKNGSSTYLGTYCSPNSYLVEQL